MNENTTNVQSLRRDLRHLALWELIVLALILVTFFGFIDRTKDKEYNFNRTSYQTKVDLYDLRIEDNTKPANNRLETGL